MPRSGSRVRIPSPAPIGFPTAVFPSVDSAVNRRFPEVLPRWLEGWRTQRLRKSLSAGSKVSEARGYADLALKLYPIDIASFMLHRAYGVSANRPHGKGYRRAEPRACPNLSYMLKSLCRDLVSRSEPSANPAHTARASRGGHGELAGVPRLRDRGLRPEASRSRRTWQAWPRSSDGLPPPPPPR